MTRDSVIGRSAAYARLDTQLPNFILVCLRVFDQLGETNKSKMKRTSNEKSDIRKVFVRTGARGEPDPAAIPVVDDD